MPFSRSRSAIGISARTSRTGLAVAVPAPSRQRASTWLSGDASTRLVNESGGIRDEGLAIALDANDGRVTYRSVLPAAGED